MCTGLLQICFVFVFPSTLGELEYSSKRVFLFLAVVVSIIRRPSSFHLLAGSSPLILCHLIRTWKFLMDKKIHRGCWIPVFEGRTPGYLMILWNPERLPIPEGTCPGCPLSFLECVPITPSMGPGLSMNLWIFQSAFLLSDRIRGAIPDGN